MLHQGIQVLKLRYENDHKKRWSNGFLSPEHKRNNSVRHKTHHKRLEENRGLFMLQDQ